MLNKLMQELKVLISESADNGVVESDALSKECIGARYFEEPIYAVATANDPMFTQLKEDVVGSHFKLPVEWSMKAKTVISFFLPFNDAVIKSNKIVGDPSNLWLHARHEGQMFVDKFAKHVVSYFESLGYASVYPSGSGDFFAVREHPELGFTSNWSERHVAYICGLGTFGLSKGLITEKGMAGRFCSIVTEAELPISERYYTEIYENCNSCGACIKRCPADAITLEGGKEHSPCHAFCSTIRKKYAPRQGCGKCQTYVPCTKRMPRKRTS